jgi:hypothetical protein
VIVVSHRNKPILGVEIVLIPSPGVSSFITVSTDAKGAADFRGLPTGKYWLIASYRGIEAGRELIEVRVHPKKPKKKFEFQWADDSYEMRSVSGKLTGLVKGNTGHPLQDLLHPL